MIAVKTAYKKLKLAGVSRGWSRGLLIPMHDLIHLFLVVCKFVAGVSRG